MSPPTLIGRGSVAVISIMMKWAFASAREKVSSEGPTISRASRSSKVGDIVDMHRALKIIDVSLPPSSEGEGYLRLGVGQFGDIEIDVLVQVLLRGVLPRKLNGRALAALAH